MESSDDFDDLAAERNQLLDDRNVLLHEQNVILRKQFDVMSDIAGDWTQAASALERIGNAVFRYVSVYEAESQWRKRKGKKASASGNTEASGVG